MSLSAADIVGQVIRILRPSGDEIDHPEAQKFAVFTLDLCWVHH